MPASKKISLKKSVGQNLFARESGLPPVVEILRGLAAIPSPSGYTGEIVSHISKIAEKAGINATKTNKGGLLIGNHPFPEIVVSGHIDTLGAMVSGINSNGSLAFTKIGGPILATFEGAYVTVLTTEEKAFRGTLLLSNPASHVNKEVATTERKPENMQIRLDAEAVSKEEVLKLGIQVGDFIFFDPKFEYVNTGFIKSHFLDDKAGSSVMIDAFLTLGSNLLKKMPVVFFFSNFEEVGHGACGGLPTSAKEMLVVDMGVVGERVEGDELSVSICVKDSSGPYDYDIRRALAKLAKELKLPYKLDVFPFYASDGSAALQAGNDLRVALIGPGVSASHGMERTHVKALEATKSLVIAYLKHIFKMR
ncbi:M42 family metallopeptidase [bacterium]|nr:M42 family metallopeptidase [bacterium]